MKLILYVAVLIFMQSCTKPKPIPVWNGKLYIGNSLTRSLERAQDNDSIPSDSAKFDKMIAMSDEDFKMFYTTYVLGCRSWGKAKLTTQPYYNNIDAIRTLYDNTELRVSKTTDR